jgi:peptidoglycan/xylan/chitin deacetylase (PgdA/CDA1 family)
VRATFFCIAREGEENAARYKRIVEEGHVLGMHSYTHEYKTVYADLKSFQNDVTKLSDFLYGITGVRPKYYRFPGGSSNTVSKVSMKKCIRFINESQLTYFDWNAQNDDATGKSYTAAQLVNHAMTNVRQAGENVVLLMHDEQTKTATAESLPKLIRQLKKANYDILPITDETPLVQHVSYDSVG